MNSTELEGFTIYWRIENFYLRRSNPNLNLESLVFKDTIFDSEWILNLQQNVSSYIGVNICKKKNPKIIPMQFSIALLTSAGWLPVLKRAKKDFVAEDEGWGVHKLVRWKKLADEDWTYLPHGSLTVNFRLWNDEFRMKSAQCLMVSRMMGNMKLKHLPIQTFDSLRPIDLLSFPVSYEMKTSVEIKAESTTQTEQNEDFEHVEDLITLLRKNKFNFVTLRSTNKDFVVHGAILCAKSPVFCALFDKKRKEESKSIIEINDIDNDTLSALLQFLHLEPIDLNWKATLKLYTAAHNYQIEPLKKICAAQLKKEFSIENICDAFILADKHQDKDLKQSALEYFCKHSKSILLSQNWENLLLNETKLASDILHEMAKNL